MTNARVALATCSQLPDLDKDDVPLIAALAERGVTAEPAVWDDPAVDWSAYDLVLVRSTWDYSPRHDEFLAWARSLPKVANSADVIRVEHRQALPARPRGRRDPRDPHDLARPGAAPVQARGAHPHAAFGDFVVKPVVSAGAKNTGRYQPVSAESRGKAIAHATRLLDDGRWVMIQPYVTSVDTAGETCLIFIDGQLTHAVRKNALLTGPAEDTSELYAEEEKEAFEATPAQIDVAERALAVARTATGADLTYARVDLVSGDDGVPMVIELEAHRAVAVDEVRHGRRGQARRRRREAAGLSPRRQEGPSPVRGALLSWGERRDLNPRPSRPQRDALPAEPRPPCSPIVDRRPSKSIHGRWPRTELESTGRSCFVTDVSATRCAAARAVAVSGPGWAGKRTSR